MRRLIVFAGTALAVAVAGCDLVQAPGGGEGKSGGASAPARDGAFSHSQSDDISGYYRASGASVGGLTLNQVFVGQTADFEAWEGGRRSATFAPVMMEFTRDGETVRVLPDRYAVSDGRISMQGTAPGIGEVSLDVRLDKGALATARRNLGGSEDAAMTGTVRVGGRGLSGVKFNWYGGD